MQLTRRQALLLIPATLAQGCKVQSQPVPAQSPAMTLPRKILPDLAWSFKEPLPANPALFVSALRAYGESVKAPVVEAELQSRFPLPSLDVEYTYAKQEDSGFWTDVPVKVRISRSAPPTYAEVLFELHIASAEKLQDQDHSYFEGLWLLDREYEKGIPVYELYLGS